MCDRTSQQVGAELRAVIAKLEARNTELEQQLNEAIASNTRLHAVNSAQDFHLVRLGIAFALRTADRRPS